jgi:hypothetical protein
MKKQSEKQEVLQEPISEQEASEFGERYKALCAEMGLAFVAEAGMEAWPGQPPKPLARLKLVRVPKVDAEVQPRLQEEEEQG